MWSQENGGDAQINVALRIPATYNGGSIHFEMGWLSCISSTKPRAGLSRRQVIGSCRLWEEEAEALRDRARTAVAIWPAIPPGRRPGPQPEGCSVHRHRFPRHPGLSLKTPVSTSSSASIFRSWIAPQHRPCAARHGTARLTRPEGHSSSNQNWRFSWIISPPAGTLESSDAQSAEPVTRHQISISPACSFDGRQILRPWKRRSALDVENARHGRRQEALDCTIKARGCAVFRAAGGQAANIPGEVPSNDGRNQRG